MINIYNCSHTHRHKHTITVDIFFATAYYSVFKNNVTNQKKTVSFLICKITLMIYILCTLSITDIMIYKALEPRIQALLLHQTIKYTVFIIPLSELLIRKLWLILIFTSIFTTQWMPEMTNSSD